MPFECWLMSDETRRYPGRRPNVARRIGGTLAGTPALVQQRVLDAERAHPPKGSFLVVRSVRLHMLTSADLVPRCSCYTATARCWQISGLAAAAARGYRLVAFDRPGFGYSDRPRNAAWTPTAQAKLFHHALQMLGIDHYLVAYSYFPTARDVALVARY
jgi:alpha/beta hydrolase fold